MKKWWERLKTFYYKCFKSHCPDCGGTMDSVYFDMFLDRQVYKCRNCGEEWV